MSSRLLLIYIVALLLAGCQQPAKLTGVKSVQSSASVGRAMWLRTIDDEDIRTTIGSGNVVSLTGAVGFMHGRPINWEDLRSSMMELIGGRALAEYVLDSGLKRRLKQRGLIVDEELIDGERTLFTASVSPDLNEAERLLVQVRREQKLGDLRFQRLLERNAGLRLLVQNHVQVVPSVVRKAYDYQYGPRYQARLIVVASLDQASNIVQRARGGDSFIQLVDQYSTDASRHQEGLLSPIRPSDTTWPVAIRSTIVQMAPNQISDPILLDHGFGVLKLEEHLEAQKVSFEDVKERLAQRARLGIERMHMQRLARELLREADLTITDSALSKSWAEHKALILAETSP